MGDKENEVRITYETLFDMFRAEKDRPDMQKIPKSFFKDLIEYINEKRKIVDESKGKTGLFVAEEKERAEKQLKNIKKIVVDLYEKREKKIVSLALEKSRLQDDFIDTSTLLDEEKELLGRLVSILDVLRKGTLFRVLEGKIPKVEEIKKEIKPETPENKTYLNGGLTNSPEIEKEEEAKEIDDEQVKPLSNIGLKEPKTEKLVRFIHAVPKFIGKELEIYGPFEEEDIANLPADIADVLVAKGRAEELEED